MEYLINLIKCGDLLALQTLITQEQFDINQKDQNGRTLLMHAVLVGTKETAEMLIKVAHANVDLIDKDGKTALMIAAELNNIDIVELLYCCRASVLIKDNHCKTVADLANCSSMIIREFIAKRIHETEVVIKFLEGLLLKENFNINKDLSDEDSLVFKILGEQNETDFMLAAFEFVLWNPIEVWDKICIINGKRRADSSDSTDSEASDNSLMIRHDTSPNVELLASIEDVIDAI